MDRENILEQVANEDNPLILSRIEKVLHVSKDVKRYKVLFNEMLPKAKGRCKLLLYSYVSTHIYYDKLILALSKCGMNGLLFDRLFDTVEKQSEGRLIDMPDSYESAFKFSAALVGAVKAGDLPLRHSDLPVPIYKPSYTFYGRDSASKIIEAIQLSDPDFDASGLEMLEKYFSPEKAKKKKVTKKKKAKKKVTAKKVTEAKIEDVTDDELDSMISFGRPNLSIDEDVFA